MASKAKLCRHHRTLCAECIVITDAAKKMSEAVALAIIANPPEITAHGWMAFALADGSTDHAIYPSKQAAIDHQSNEFRYCYLNLAQCLGGMPVKDAQLWLDLHRQAYDNGLRLTDPNQSLIMPQGREQWITKRTF